LTIVSTDFQVGFLDPCQNADWDEHLSRRPEGAFFHTRAWAQVLVGAYGHRPFYACHGTGSGAQFLPLMEVRSALTGRRGVSIPFSDFCVPLAEGSEAAAALQRAALDLGRNRGWRYLEFRGACNLPGATPSLEFLTHTVDLEEHHERMFQRLDPAGRRAIRKAESGGVQISYEADAAAMKVFYGLHCLTRKRHGLPPQPFRFFELIAKHVFPAGRGIVAIARLDDRPVAACVFCYQGSEAIYKFGASDFRFQQFRANNLAMWAAMKRFATLGVKRLHFGRTSLGNEGLRRFKLGFGAHESTIQYFRYDYQAGRYVKSLDRSETWINHIFNLMPAPFLRLAGHMLYPHLS